MVDLGHLFDQNCSFSAKCQVSGKFILVKKMRTRPILHCKLPCKDLLGFNDHESDHDLRAS